MSQPPDRGEGPVDDDLRVPDWPARVAELERRLAEETGRLNRLLALAAQLSAAASLDELLEMLAEAACQLLDARASSILLLDDEREELVFLIVAGDSAGDLVQQRIPASAGIAGWTLIHRQPAVSDDPRTDERFLADIDGHFGTTTRNLLAVPLMARDTPVGVLEVLDKRVGSFGPTDVASATALGTLAGVAIHTNRLLAQLTDDVVTRHLCGPEGRAAT
jgi:GAF domain-containing protein